MNTMTCLKCEREFEIGHHNSTLHVYREELFLRCVKVSCECGQDYQLFTDEETDQALMMAGIVRVIDTRPTPEVRDAFNQLCRLKLEEEYEKEVAQLASELEEV